MKSTATQPTPGGWNSPNTGATNSSGFTGLSGGYRGSGGGFINLGHTGSWWSSSDAGSGYAWNRNLSYDFARANRYVDNHRNGFSVRCARDWTSNFDFFGFVRWVRVRSFSRASKTREKPTPFHVWFHIRCYGWCSVLMSCWFQYQFLSLNFIPYYLPTNSINPISTIYSIRLHSKPDNTPNHSQSTQSQWCSTNRVGPHGVKCINQGIFQYWKQNQHQILGVIYRINVLNLHPLYSPISNPISTIFPTSFTARFTARFL